MWFLTGLTIESVEAAKLKPVTISERIPVGIRASKVPEVSVLFWVIKVLTTGTGETTSDFFVKAFDPVPVVLIAAVVFVVCLAIQLRAPRYVAWRYWLLVAMVGVFGTMVADVTHIVVGVPYEYSTAAFAIILAAVFITWWSVERTLSIHSIITRRRELFYWATVIATFALGTAAGDLTATSLHLGYLGSGLLFAVAIAVPGIAYAITRRGAVLFFWIAYVLTRPLGASFADWLGVDHSRGGLAIGTAAVSLVGAACVAALVAVLAVRTRRLSAHSE
jgi:uncharacterized membrane-anchored protein